MIASVMLFMLLIPVTVGAASREHLHGVVLGVVPKTGELIVRHDPFGGMPGMTMTFRVRPPSRARELQPGTVIDATVDVSHDPWTLSSITPRSAQPVTTEPVLRRVTPLRTGDTVPDTPFLDQRGRRFAFSQLRGQDVVLAFVYTRCRDARMCPLISGKFHALQSTMGKRKVHLVEVTLDPAFDRPAVLSRYGRLFGADPSRWTLAVGDEKATLDFAAQFGVTAFPDPAVGLIHAEDTVLIDPDGRINEMITENSWAPDEIYAQIDATRGLASNPVKRFDLWLSRQAVALCGNAVGRFSGLADLGIVVLIFGVFGWCVWRLSRVFIENV
ncbi:MAG: SCO family protein [Candidatus Velthaea sp.]